MARPHPNGRGRAPRCVTCRKPLEAGESTVDRLVPAGHLMSQAHREVTARWHPDCWAAAEGSAAESRAEAEQQRLATIREIAEAGGIPPERVSQIAADMGAPDPYAAKAGA